MATAGFTATVVAAAAAGRLDLQRRRPPSASAPGSASLSYIFAVAMLASVVAFFVVLFFYREPAASASPGQAEAVGRAGSCSTWSWCCGSGRFSLYLVVMSGFYFIYNQVYNVLPLYVKKVVETDPAMDLYTAANPFVIVCFQLILTSTFGKMKPIRSMVVGTVDHRRRHADQRAADLLGRRARRPCSPTGCRSRRCSSS